MCMNALVLVYLCLGRYSSTYLPNYVNSLTLSASFLKIWVCTYIQYVMCACMYHLLQGGKIPLLVSFFFLSLPSLKTCFPPYLPALPVYVCMYVCIPAKNVSKGKKKEEIRPRREIMWGGGVELEFLRPHLVFTFVGVSLGVG